MDLSDLLHFSIKPVQNNRLKRLLLKKLGADLLNDGRLDTIQKTALKAAQILNSTNPRLRNPVILVFAGDHGVAHPLSDYLQDEAATEETLLSFLNGTSSVNVFSKNAELDMKVIDLGVNHSFEGTLTYWLNHGTKFINRKQAFGTRDFQEFPAITTTQLYDSLKVGLEMVDRERKTGCNVIGFGEAGKGGKLAAWALAAALLDRPISELISDESPEVISYLDKAVKTHPKTHDVHTLLCLFGSFDMAAMVGAMLRAAHHRMIIIIDGVYSCVAALAASKLAPNFLDYSLFSYESHNKFHQILLDELEAKPLVQLDVKSVGGSAVAFTYPLLKNALDLVTANNRKN